MSTAVDVAAWMAAELRAKRELYQQDTVSEIEQRFGEEFMYYNDRGNAAIARSVLKEFDKLTQNDAVWVQSGKYWRLRDQSDLPGRKQEA